MSVLSVHCLGLITFLYAAFGAGGDASPLQIPKSLGPQFQRYACEHFEFFSDAAPAVVRKTEQMAEDTFLTVESWSRELGLGAGKTGELLRIVFFKDERAYSRFAERCGLKAEPDVPGYFDEQRNFCVVLDIAGVESIRRKKDELFIARRELTSTASGAGAATSPARQHRLEQIRAVEQQIAEHEKAINATVVRHEIAHMVMFRLGLQRGDDRNRRWLKEGVAMQFESPGGGNAYRLADFREIPVGEMRSLVREVIADPERIGPGAAEPARAYAVAWALVHYLTHQHKDAFRDYVAKDDPGSKAQGLEQFELRFGKVDDGFIDGFNQFMGKQTP